MGTFPAIKTSPGGDNIEDDGAAKAGPEIKQELNVPDLSSQSPKLNTLEPDSEIFRNQSETMAKGGGLGLGLGLGPQTEHLRRR